VTPRHPPGPPMDLANMREQGVAQLIAFCHNDACRHQAVIDAAKYPGDTLVSWFKGRIKCGKCGRRGSPSSRGCSRCRRCSHRRQRRRGVSSLMSRNDKLLSQNDKPRFHQITPMHVALVYPHPKSTVPIAPRRTPR
jgi:hypothetical protein